MRIRIGLPFLYSRVSSSLLLEIRLFSPELEAADSNSTTIPSYTLLLYLFSSSFSLTFVLVLVECVTKLVLELKYTRNIVLKFIYNFI